LHGYASATPTSDGSAVYAFFGSSGVAAFRLDGEPLWRADVGEGTDNGGSATSPILFDDLLIVNASVESGSILALDKASGSEVWRTPGIVRSWSTPLIVDVPGGGRELVVSMENKTLGLDPATGRQLWECASVEDYVCPAVIAHNGVVYVTGGRTPYTMAVRAGGRGDVTRTHRLWNVSTASKVPTPLVHDGHLYWIDQQGVAVCLDAATGRAIYQERLEIEGQRDKIYASLVLADGKLFGVSRLGGTVVLAAKPEFEQLARNDLGDESVFNATPVPDGGRLLIRSDRFLYCIGK
jgi:outer membrane protein assembly factor BamB